MKTLAFVYRVFRLLIATPALASTYLESRPSVQKPIARSFDPGKKEGKMQRYWKLYLLTLTFVLLVLFVLTENPRAWADDDHRASDARDNKNFQPIEPNAGSWRTWIISSGKDFRVASPPDAAATR